MYDDREHAFKEAFLSLFGPSGFKGQFLPSFLTFGEDSPFIKVSSTLAGANKTFVYW
jgi:hypothetical protein